MVAKLKDIKAYSLMSISTPEERFVAFQAGIYFENPPTKGSKGFVSVNGKDEFRGIVQLFFPT
jgi:hypothetical protein